METMDYNYFASSAAQPYQYALYGDNGLLHQGVSNDGAGPIPVSSRKVGGLVEHPTDFWFQSLENGLDNSHFLSNTFYDASFDGPLPSGSGLTPLPTTSASPPANQISLLPNGSVDSGIELGLDEQQARRRSSSEEKDSLTPAQSRRKAQNRAA